jgi:glutamate dehydrogenase (NADP+)
MSAYTNNVLEMLSQKYPWEKEYIQSVSEVFKSIAPVVDSNVSYQYNRILEQLVEIPLAAIPNTIMKNTIW